MFKNTWEKMKAFWQGNMEKNYRKISIAFGIFLISLLWASISVVSFYLGALPDIWGQFLSKGYEFFIIFMALFIGVLFGNEKTNGNNGNGSEEPKPDGQ